MKHLLEYDKYVQPEAPVNEGFIFDMYPRFINWLKGWYKKITGSSTDTKTKGSVVNASENLPVEMQGEHMLYVPHQQGGRGSAKLFLAAKGKYKLEQKDIDKIKSNMPSSDPGYKIITDPKKSSKEKALAYFRYWKKKWEAYSRDAKSNITKHPKVDSGIKKNDDKHPKFFSNDFLTTVAWIESRFDPLAGKNKSYKGLFQIGNDAFSDLKKTYRDRTYVKRSTIPLDTIENPQMGNDYLKWSYDRFQSNLKDLEGGKA